MITKAQALYYSEQLHPSFAGYIHDGEVTVRDALATIMHFLKKGYIDPIWKKNNINRGVASARKMSREPEFEFEKKIIDELFRGKRCVSASEIGKLVKSGRIQEIIRQNSGAIRFFHIGSNKLKFRLGEYVNVNFTVNDKEVDTVLEANQFKQGYKLLLVIWTGFNFVFFVQFLVGKEFDRLLSILFSQGIILLIGGIFLVSKKVVTYQFENKIYPLVKEKYTKLYHFLKKHHYIEHRFTNQFLAYAIAFGIDNSWFADFGLDKDIEVDISPMII